MPRLVDRIKSLQQTRKGQQIQNKMITIKVEDAQMSESSATISKKKIQKASLPQNMTFDDPTVFYSTYWMFYVLQSVFERQRQTEKFYPSDRMYASFRQTFVVGQKKTSQTWFERIDAKSEAYKALGDSRALVLASEVTESPGMYSIVLPSDIGGQLIRFFGFHCEVPVDRETALDKILETITYEPSPTWSEIALRLEFKSCLLGTQDDKAKAEGYYMGGYKCNEHSEVYYPVHHAVKDASGVLKITEALEGYRKTYRDRPDIELTRSHFILYGRSLYLFDIDQIIDKEWNRRLDILLTHNIGLDHAGNPGGKWYIRDTETGQHKGVSRELWRQKTGAAKRIKLE